MTTNNLGGDAPSNIPRSIGAVVAGFMTVAVLSLCVDQLLHMFGFYPPWGEPMHDPVQNAVALAYRLVITLFGGWLTARLAPRNAMRHVWVLAGIGLFMGTTGAVVTIPMNLGPAWYPIALAATAIPCTWLGGWLWARQSAMRRA